MRAIRFPAKSFREVDAAVIVAAITRSSVEHLNLQPGDRVRVVVKSTEVMIAK